MMQLPPLLLLNVFEFLPHQDLCLSLSCVNKSFRDVIETPVIWQALYKNVYPDDFLLRLPTDPFQLLFIIRKNEEKFKRYSGFDPNVQQMFLDMDTALRMANASRSGRDMGGEEVSDIKSRGQQRREENCNNGCRDVLSTNSCKRNGKDVFSEEGICAYEYERNMGGGEADRRMAGGLGSWGENLFIEMGRKRLRRMDEEMNGHTFIGESLGELKVLCTGDVNSLLSESGRHFQRIQLDETEATDGTEAAECALATGFESKRAQVSDDVHGTKMELPMEIAKDYSFCKVLQSTVHAKSVKQIERDESDRRLASLPPHQLECYNARSSNTCSIWDSSSIERCTHFSKSQENESTTMSQIASPSVLDDHEPPSPILDASPSQSSAHEELEKKRSRCYLDWSSANHKMPLQCPPTNHTCSSQFCKFAVFQEVDLYICKSTGKRHVCDKSCDLAVYSDQDWGFLVCPISGRMFETSRRYCENEWGHTHEDGYVAERGDEGGEGELGGFLGRCWAAGYNGEFWMHWGMGYRGRKH